MGKFLSFIGWLGLLLFGPLIIVAIVDDDPNTLAGGIFCAVMTICFFFLIRFGRKITAKNTQNISPVSETTKIEDKRIEENQLPDVPETLPENNTKRLNLNMFAFQCKACGANNKIQVVEGELAACDFCNTAQSTSYTK